MATSRHGSSPPASPTAPPDAADGSNGHQPAAARARAQIVATRVHGAPSGPPAAPVYKGLVTRTIAFVIDAAIIDAVAALTGVAIALVISLLPGSHKHQATLVAIGGAAFLVWAGAYFVVFW